MEELLKDLKIANDNLYSVNQMLDKEIERLKEDNEYLNKVNIELSTLNTSLRSDRDNYKYIINELEKMMKNDLECACSMNENGLFNGYIDILEVYLDELQELKGSESNE